MFSYAVIGKGLIGTAVARYLSQQSPSVALIGLDEPADFANHAGPFASHYDSGRITRRLDRNLVWAQLADRSIGRYRQLEQESGLRFYQQTGGVMAGAMANNLEQVTAVAQQLQLPFTTYPATAIPPEFGLQFPPNLMLLHEANGAGYIDPRQLVQAQIAIAKQQGTAVIPQTVTSLQITADHLTIHTDGDQTISAQKVIVAAGAYTTFLLPRRLAFIIKPRTIVMAQLNAAESQRLAQMPTTIYSTDQEATGLEGIYSVPPARYPDGHTYLKIGGQLPNVQPVTTAVALQQWFNQGGSQLEANRLQAVLLAMVPKLQAEKIISKPCVVTDTAHGYPYIDTLADGKIVVAAGGNGAAAKSSDEIGRLAALLATGQWDKSLARQNFQIVWE